MDVFPTLEDMQAIITYAFAHPYSFITRPTVMTLSLLIAMVGVGVVRRRSPFLHRIAPSVSVILIYFGIGSLAVATQFLLRYHDAYTHWTEVQLVSGFTHLIGASAGVVLLHGHLRGRTRAEWMRANTVALAYWAGYLALVMPEWFTFDDQGEVIRAVTLGILAVIAAITALVLRRGAGRTAGSAPYDRRARSTAGATGG